MADRAANIQTRLDAIYEELATLPSTPDYSLEGEAVSLDAHRQSLLAEAKQLQAELDRLAGDWTVPTIGY